MRLRWTGRRLPWLLVPTAPLFVWAVARALGLTHPILNAAASFALVVYIPTLFLLCFSRQRTVDRQLVLSGQIDRRFAAAARASEEMVWEVDPGGRILYAGPTAEAFLGYRPDELVDRPVSTILPEFEWARMARRLADSLYPACGWTNDPITYLTKDGDLRLLLSSAVAHADSAGHAIGFAGTLREPSDPNAQVILDQLRDQIRHIIDDRQLTSVFQPIVDARTATVIGAESLTRFAVGDPARTPDTWFTDAARVGLGPDLELFAVSSALAAGHALPEDIYLSINLSPAALLTGRLPDLISGSGWHPARLVLEITEHVAISEYEPLAESIAELRARGLRLAVDDAGAGYASFRHILALSPDYIKLDRSLIQDLDADPSRRALIRAMMTFAGEVGATVIAEGIETPAELDTIRALGVQAAQGFLSGRPAPAAQWVPRAVAVTSPHSQHPVGPA